MHNITYNFFHLADSLPEHCSIGHFCARTRENSFDKGFLCSCKVKKITSTGLLREIRGPGHTRNVTVGILLDELRRL